MNGKLIVDRKERKLVMSREFEKYARIVGTDEYNALIEAMSAFPTYGVERKRNKKNSRKNTYGGLTYAKMEDYILTHPNYNHNMMVYQELRERGELNRNKAYPTIKRWFLDTYPEVRDFGKDFFKNTEVEFATSEMQQEENEVA